MADNINLLAQCGIFEMAAFIWRSAMRERDDMKRARAPRPQVGAHSEVL